MNKLITSALLMISAVFLSPANAIDIVTRCDNCSNPASLARNLAGSQSRFGVTVFIADFGRDRAFNYFVIDNNPLSPEGKEIDPFTVLNEVVGNTQILNEDVIEGTRIRGSTRVIQIAIPQREQDHFDDFVWFENFLSSNGINTSFNNVRASVAIKATDINSVVNRESSPLDGCPRVASTINVTTNASQPVSSAFQIIDFGGGQAQVGNAAIAQSPILTEAVRLLQAASDIAIFSDSFVEINYGFRLRFIDGGSGIFRFDPARRLVGESGCFVDAEENQIPEDENDIGEGFMFTGVGLPDNNDSMNSMIDRLNRLGRPVEPASGGGNGGGNGGGTPRICTITCTASVCFRECF